MKEIVTVQRKNRENILNIPQYFGMLLLQGEALQDPN